MMRYAIRHETRFDYDAPVQFARCNLRLRPIDWPGQSVEQFALSVDPGGSVSRARDGAFLAHVDRLLVAEPVRSLSIISTAEICVDRLVPAPDPKDPDLESTARMALDTNALGPAAPAHFLYPSPMIPLDPEIAQWSKAMLDAKAPILQAAMNLALEIQREFTFDPHATITSTPPAQAFAKRAGVCQDFAQIMISALRAAGLPAAYASGYLRTLPPPGKPRLVGADAMHAWVLIWCGPKRGWVGVDPTNGIWMAEDHILIAMGRDYSDIAPIDGVFTGYGAQDVSVAVDVEPIGVAA